MAHVDSSSTSRLLLFIAESKYYRHNLEAPRPKSSISLPWSMHASQGIRHTVIEIGANNNQKYTQNMFTTKMCETRKRVPFYRSSMRCCASVADALWEHSRTRAFQHSKYIIEYSTLLLSRSRLPSLHLKHAAAILESHEKRESKSSIDFTILLRTWVCVSLVTAGLTTPSLLLVLSLDSK